MMHFKFQAEQTLDLGQNQQEIRTHMCFSIDKYSHNFLTVKIITDAI